MGHTNYATGHEAEEYAARYLEKLGYKIRDVNWKSRVCEIDIISQKSKVLYFVEVKYRTNTLQGSGLEYITTKKLEQMKFAAELWVQAYKWSGSYQLAVIEVSGKKFEVTNFLTDIY